MCKGVAPVCLAFLICDEQRGGTIFQCLVLIRIDLQQEPYNLQLSTPSCNEHWRHLPMLCPSPHWPPATGVSPRGGRAGMPPTAGLDDPQILNLGLAASGEDSLLLMRGRFWQHAEAPSLALQMPGRSLEE